MVEVIESLTPEQLLLVARWLDVESEILECTLANVTVLPDISAALKICARLVTTSQASGLSSSETSATAEDS
ncbi:MAG: hypothetical protein AAF716_02020 [Cyanobacteria bacterium P01_D01_bin.1]